MSQSPRLAVLIPTRGRPGNLAKVVAAWDFTQAWEHADMTAIVDRDDPEFQGYLDLFESTKNPDGDARFSLLLMDEWMPMVHKLNKTASYVALTGKYFALGFAGDDHVPQTINWARRYLTVLEELGTGMVFGDDGYQGANLSTEWAVTSDAVLALGRMVPADVEHMYCDNSIMTLFHNAGALRHLPEVRIEHMHPIVGKAANDEQYKKVNSRIQFKRDGLAYAAWLNASTGMATDVDTIQALRVGLPEVRPEKEVRRKDGTDPAPGPRRGAPGARKGRRLPYPRHFRLVRAATPDEILMTLADFAAMVPSDEEIVELGVFQGRSSLMLAWGAKQGNGAHVTGVDPWDLPGNVYDPPFTDPGSEGWARYWIQSQGYSDRIELIKAFSAGVADLWASKRGKKVGLLFVDGDHTREGARRDIEAWAPHLAEGARIAVDDYGHPDWPGVGEAVDELVAEGVLAPIEIFHDRLAVTRLVGVGEPSREDQGAPGAASSEPAPTAITSEGVHPEPILEFTSPDLETLNLGQLRAMAKARGIKAQSKSRPEILRLLRGA